MARYRNGYIPDSALITFHTGWSQNDKDFKWQLPPSTYRKHLALVARAKKRTKRTLSPSQGWSCFRPYRVQIYARQMYGNGAAYPGTSSHGGFWEGKDTAAIDYGNWGYVYGWDRDAFYADCRAVGLTPGQIHPSRNRTYPDEPWHVIDLDPWAPVPADVPEVIILEELADMDKVQIVHLFTKASKTWMLVGATVPGGYRTTGSQETVNAWAHIYGPSTDTKTQIMFDVVKREAKALAASWLAQQKAIHG